MSQSRFVWHQLDTSDPNAAKSFYKSLLGWTFKDNDMGGMTYTEIGLNGASFGGIMAQMDPPGIPPHWGAYLYTDDVDAGAEQVKQLGGQIFYGPEDIPNVGRFAVVADPQGATFNLFKPSGEGEMPPKPAKTPPGAVAWNELLTSDPNAALEFYGKLFGWTS
jgi:uncharacterized protein